MAEQNAEQYIVLVPQIWHTGEHKTYFGGDVVTLAHLSAEERAHLVDLRVVAPVSFLQELERVQGIGREHARALAAAGIFSIAQLVETPAAEIEERAPALGVREVEQWQASARALGASGEGAEGAGKRRASGTK